MVKLNYSENDSVNNWRAILLLGVYTYTKVINENWDDFIIDITTYTAK
jgi:hypothetical protein